MTDITLKEIQEICRQNTACRSCPMSCDKYSNHGVVYTLFSIPNIDLAYLEQKIKEYKQTKEKK